MSKLIAQSFLDNDAYKFSMGDIARKWPNAMVTYKYTNRQKDYVCADGFADALREQVEMMSSLVLTPEEFEFMRVNMPWLKLDYLEWLRQFRYDPSQVSISQQDGKLNVSINGPWYKTIYWEVPLLYTISRLRYTTFINGEKRQPEEGWKDTIRRKGDQMVASKVSWIDFGARRRFDYAIEDEVVRCYKDYQPFFRGTSNPHLAMKHKVKVFGTFAHEYVMAMQALHSIKECNRYAMEYWANYYRGDLGIALTDTVTTDVFFHSFDKYFAKLFDGLRQDSGNPHEFAEKAIAHYEKLGIDPTSKVIVFSDSLDPGKACTLSTKFSSRIKVTCGIGTNLTHDVGYPAMNHVIKMVAADFGSGMIDLVKLPDDINKATGTPRAIEFAKYAVGIG